MSFIESLKQAFDSLKSNKLRTILTMLGIVMGIFSVITIISIGNSTQLYLTSELEKLGANAIHLASGSSDSKLTLDDLELIKKAAPQIKNIKAELSGLGTIVLDNEDVLVQYTGVTNQHRSFTPIEMLYGRFINEIDIDYENNVIVIDKTSAERIFNRSDVVGEKIEFKDYSTQEKLKFTIIGVTESDAGLFGEMMAAFLPITSYVPVTTSMKYQNKKNVESISVTVESEDELALVGNRMVKALKFRYGADKKYTSSSSVDIQKSMSSVTMVVSGVLLVIAIVTLLVGGIGIVNILLVSVSERIREIGIRKALGAQKRDIVLQFISESIIITLISGIIGITLGVIIGAVISNYLKIPPVVDIKIILITILGSIALGLVFGVYPAKKAADLDPIESLRYE